jgi:hypothetical protein
MSRGASYLLDSHALLWWWVGPDRLSTAVRELLELSGAIADLPGLLQAVRRILAKHDVHRNQAQLVNPRSRSAGRRAASTRWSTRTGTPWRTLYNQPAGRETSG